MYPNQQIAAPRTQTSFFFLIFLIPFIAIMSAMVLIILSSPPSFKNSFSFLHQVPEGHVGVYWRGGALHKTITKPGFQVKMPFITQYVPIQVTFQTDEVPNISCVSKGGIKISFKKIQVVHRLKKEYVYETLLNYGLHYKKTWIHDKIHHHIIQFCTSHSVQEVYIDKFVQIGGKMKEAFQVDCTCYAPGIEIISVHVTKLDIPDSISRNFKQLEEERLKVLIAVEKQKVSEASKKTAISEAEKNSNMRKILMEQTLLAKEGSRSQQEIENQMYIQRERCRADANFYWATKEAEANKLKLTPEYLELKYIEAFGKIANRTSGDNMFLFGLFHYLQLLARFVFGLAQNMIL